MRRILGGIVLVVAAGCAFMDLSMQTHTLSDSYGSLQPRVDCSGSFPYYTGLPPKQYTELANVSVTLSTTNLFGSSPWPPDRMIAYLARTACEKGADALINVKVETRNYGSSGGVVPVVTGTAVRFDEE